MTFRNLLVNFGLTLNPKFTLTKLRAGFIFLKYKFYFTSSGKVKKIFPKHRIYFQKRRFKRLLKATKTIKNQEVRLNTIFQHINGVLETIRKSDSAKILIPSLTSWYQNQLNK